MLRRPAARGAVALAAAALVWPLAGTSLAAPTETGPCGGQDLFVTVCAESPGSPGGSKRVPRNSGKGGGGSGKKSSKPSCAVERIGKAPVGSALWGGSAGGGKKSIYQRDCPWEQGIENAGNLFVAPDAEPPPPVMVDPAELAQEALDKMLLAPPKVITSPKPGDTGLIGMPVWLAVDKSSKTRFGPQTAKASAGGVTVTATATVDRVSWKLGDGASESCTPAEMKPYRKAYGKKDSPCGHRYKTLPEGAEGGKGTFQVSATSHWTVTWKVEGSEEGGTFAETRVAPDVDIAIAELQVVN